MAETFANNATGNLNASITNVATSLVLQAGQGAAFPASGNFRIVFQDTGEIALVGARSGDTLSSITRGIEGTAAAAHNAGIQVIHELTAAALGVFAQTPLALSSLVAGSNGQFIQTLGGAAVWAGGYATTLPASPSDGQHAILVDSITLPTYQWLFRWNNGSSNADKWEFVGGIPAYVGVQDGGTSETTTSTTYAVLTTAGPSFALPRAGVYDIEIGFTGGDSAVFQLMSYDIGAAGAVDGDAVRLQNSATATAVGSAHRVQRKTGLTAVTLTAKYKSSAAGTAAFTQRYMRVTPVRVS